MAGLKQHIAIDIGTSEIKVALLSLSGSSVTIKKLVSEDATHVERDKLSEKLKDILNNSFTKYELSKSTASILLSYPFVEIKRMELPGMPREEIKDAIAWQAKDRATLDIEKSFFDFIVTDEIVEEYGTKKFIVISLISPKEIINKFASLSKEMDIEISGINACPFVLSNMLNAYAKDIRNEITSVVEIGSDHTYISLYKRNLPVFLRVVPIASSQITNAVAGTVESDENKVELTREKAEVFKKKYGIPINTSEETIEGMPTRQILARMRPALESLSMEIKRSFDYFTSELNGSQPVKVFITGGGAELKNLDVFLKDELKIDVEKFKLPQYVKNESGKDEGPFLSAISTALGDMYASPNLLPIEFRKRKLQRVEKISIRMAGFTAFSVLIVLYIILSSRESDYKNRIRNANAHRSIIQNLVDKSNEVSKKKALLAKITGDSLSYIDIMKSISNIIPADIMLESLSIDSDSKRMHLTGTLYYQTGTAEEIMASLMENIENSELFSNAELRGVRKVAGGKENISSFEIECEIK